MIDGGDDPIDGSEQAPDLLGRGHFAQTVVEALSAVRRQRRSSVLGLVGPWGCGKSSVINLVREQLRRDEAGWRLGTFTPWLYSDLETLQLGFFDELRDALPDDHQWNLTRERIAKLALAVSPAANVQGVDASGLVRAGAAKWGGLSADAIKRKAEAALEKSGVPILMVLDDIDRLTPAELLLVFKLIRVAGRLPNVYYLIAYDEQTVLDLLANTDLIDHDRSTRRARDYLEKIVQIRLDIPPLRAQDGSELLNRELARFLLKQHLEGRVDLVERFTSVYYESLVDRLNTPRSIRRYVSQLEALYGRLAPEVDLADFMLLTWLRIAEPAAYKLVQRHRAELTGTIPNRHELADYTPNDDASSAVSRWKGRLGKAGLPDHDHRAVLSVLGQLFPRIGLALRGASHPMDDSTLAFVHQRKGVAHVDFFDRYFAIGIPPDDLADAEVSTAVDDLAEGLELNGTVRAALQHDTARVLRKFDTARSRETFPAIPLVSFLVDLYPALPQRSDAILSERESIRAFIDRTLPEAMAKATGDEADRLVATMSASETGLMLLTSAATVMPGTAEPWFKARSSTIFAAVASRIAEATAPGAVSDLLWPSFWAWQLVDEPAASESVRCQVGSGRWALYDTAACLFATIWPAANANDLPDPRLIRIGQILGFENLNEFLGALGAASDGDDGTADLDLRRSELFAAAFQAATTTLAQSPDEEAQAAHK
ncbi:P-loop NTPase fold protein [Kribbella sp. NPDC050124]|uniref:KAP family P-loop NTPase fold protein n=1 Tax=Kribbella sp. NPDC050124 TaxID=3364114 RepID=UPI003791CEDB